MKEIMTCDINATLLDVMEVIKENGKAIAFIIDKKHKLHGVISDGDIRRLLLQGHPLQQSVKKVMNRNFVYARHTDSPREIVKMINEAIRVIPIVDDDFIYVDHYEVNTKIHIPVAAPHLKGNELKYLIDAFLSTWISSSGDYIIEFEKAFAKFCNTKYAVTTSNGTSALHLALLALDIGKGDEVIIPDLTFVATINAVLYVGAKPVIVDIEQDSWCIDPKEVAKAITKKTKAIIPVHLYGQPANMDEIMKIAKKHKLRVIEDSAQAHGATFAGKVVGSIGDIGCFSFFGNKVITTGEGGMCITNSKKLAEKIRIYKNHGMSKKKKYWHNVIGYNYRMTNLQAAIGLAQLERIKEILLSRQDLEATYKQELRKVEHIEFQRTDLPKRKKITWLVSVLIKKGDRNKLIDKLQKEGVDTRPFFYPMSIMKLYKQYVFSNKNSKKIAKMGINFPTTHDINNSVFASIRKAMR